MKQFEKSRLKSKMCVKINRDLGELFLFLLYLFFWPCSCLELLLFLLRPFKLVKDCLDASLPSLRLTSVPNVW